mmetsp:Transcript_36668/g.79368  ORF Transcript_36668/g.79368 Transcript_36668/m.79368 type:complete len:484 (-) Transcript_36668:31-1482(-)
MTWSEEINHWCSEGRGPAFAIGALAASLAQGGLRWCWSSLFVNSALDMGDMTSALHAELDLVRATLESCKLEKACKPSPVSIGVAPPAPPPKMPSTMTSSTTVFSQLLNDQPIAIAASAAATSAPAAHVFDLGRLLQEEIVEPLPVDSAFQSWSWSYIWGSMWWSLALLFLDSFLLFFVLKQSYESILQESLRGFFTERKARDELPQVDDSVSAELNSSSSWLEHEEASGGSNGSRRRRLLQQPRLRSGKSSKAGSRRRRGSRRGVSSDFRYDSDSSSDSGSGSGSSEQGSGSEAESRVHSAYSAASKGAEAAMQEQGRDRVEAEEDEEGGADSASTSSSKGGSQLFSAASAASSRQEDRFRMSPPNYQPRISREDKAAAAAANTCTSSRQGSKTFVREAVNPMTGRTLLSEAVFRRKAELERLQRLRNCTTAVLAVASLIGIVLVRGAVALAAMTGNKFLEHLLSYCVVTLRLCLIVLLVLF